MNVGTGIAVAAPWLAVVACAFSGVGGDALAAVGLFAAIASMVIADVSVRHGR